MTYRVDEIEVPSNDPFRNDQLERKPVVDFLSELIGRIDGPFVVALDSPFGTGKSTLVRILTACLEKKGQMCIYFNAWKVDYATDPLVAIVAHVDRLELTLLEESQRTTFRNHIDIVKTIATAIVETSLANTVRMLTSEVVDPKAIISAIESSESKTNRNRNAISEFNRELNLIEIFRDELTEAVTLLRKDDDDDDERQSNDTACSNLVIFIDELDRCRPTFAIQLLERIKHIFDIPNIIFVLSLDKKQIEAIIKAVYGSEIDATEYLRRFFNLEFGIPDSDTKSYISSLIKQFKLDPIFAKRSNQASQYDREHFVEYLNVLANAAELSLRAIERCITRLQIVMDQTPSNHYLDPVLLALLIVLHSNKREYYHQIINGEVSPKEAIDFLSSFYGSKMPRNNILVLYAYLLVADPDHARSITEIKGLMTKESEDQEAGFILNVVRGIQRLGRNHISLDNIARKIDLAAWVK